MSCAIVTYLAHGQGFQLIASEGGWEFFSSPPRLERLWSPPDLLSNGY